MRLLARDGRPAAHGAGARAPTTRAAGSRSLAGPRSRKLTRREGPGVRAASCRSVLRVIKPIFDDVVRTDASPAHEEDSFTFLNRVATPYWARVRDFVDETFASYPAEHAEELRMRFRSRRWPEHIGAWWELYLYRLFRSLGFEVELHPALPGVTTRPDFRVHGGDLSFLVEARHVAAGIMSGQRQVGRDDWITAPLDELTHPNFMVRVKILERESQRPRRAAVTAGVLDWLDGLDPDDLAGPVQDLPRFPGRAGGWRFELKALPVRAEARGRADRRLVGLYPGSGGFDNTTAALRAALKEKASKYGRPECPFLLAPLVTSGHLDTEDVVGALFGTEAIQVSGDDLEHVRVIRRRDGFWISGDGFRGTRITAVLIGSAVLPWTAAKALPRLWLNPGAAHPLSTQLKLPSASLDADGHMLLSGADSSGADLFGLQHDWPGPEGPFAT